MVLSMMVWLGVQCYWLLDKYFHYPIDVKLDLKISSELEFPSVTVCNMNPILKNKIRDLQFRDLQHYANRPKEDDLLKTTREKYLMAKEQRPCKSTEFTCQNNRCVLQRFRCDGTNNCWNNLDEMNCENYKCKDDYFKCSDDTCKLKTDRCNGVNDCPEGDDEKNCSDHVCKEGYFQCLDYTCRNNASVCDGKIDCPYGEDEKNCKDHTCMDGYTKCADGVCIWKSYWCNGHKDCTGGEDERMCKAYRCMEGYTQCADGVCILEQNWCDGHNSCQGGEDEIKCKDHTCMEGYMQCSDGVCVPENLWCNVVENCKGREDEHNCEDYECPEGYFRCSNQACYHPLNRCNGYPLCPDGEDETGCESYECDESRFKCSDNKCWSKVRYLCDGPIDCPNGEDEENCNVTATCPKGSFACPTEGNCIPNTYLNDGFVDCVTGADESLYNNASLRPQERKIRRNRRGAEDKEWRPDILLESMESTHHMTDSLSDLQQIGNGLDSIPYIDPTFRKHNGLDQLEKYINSKRVNINPRKKRDTGLESSTVETLEEFPDEVNQEKEEETFSKWQALDTKNFGAIKYYSERGSDWQAAMAYGYISAKASTTVLEQSGHKKENFIASCEFNGYQCSPSNFTFVHNYKYGSCFTFNSEGPVLKTRFQGPENGLKLELFINQRAYVANLATEAGARIVVHKRGTMPFPENNGVSVMPGRSTSIGLHQVRLSRLSYPHGDCGSDKFDMDSYAHLMGTEYSKLSCTKSCYQLIILENCGCAAPFYVVLPEMKVCDMLHNETEKCVSDLFQFDRFHRCEDKCPQPCEEINYDVSISSAKWPSNQYQEYLKERLIISNSAYFRSRITDDFAKVQIYFKDMIYTHIQQNKAYESMNLISDLGGQLGLWLGLSAITIGELCSFFFILSRSVTSTWFSGAETSPDEASMHSKNVATTLEEIYDDLYPEAAKYTPPDVDQFRLKLRSSNKQTSEL